MTRIDAQTDALVSAWLSLPEAANALDSDERRIRQLLRERKLLACDRESGLQIPATFIRDGQVIKGLSGVLTLLADAGYDEGEAMRWLFTPDDTLPGAPVAALAEDRGKEVKRRAQALGF